MRRIFLLLLITTLTAGASIAGGARVKDLAVVSGARENQLVVTASSSACR